MIAMNLVYKRKKKEGSMQITDDDMAHAPIDYMPLVMALLLCHHVLFIVTILSQIMTYWLCDVFLNKCAQHKLTNQPLKHKDYNTMGQLIFKDKNF